MIKAKEGVWKKMDEEFSLGDRDQIADDIMGRIKEENPFFDDFLTSIKQKFTLREYGGAVLAYELLRRSEELEMEEQKEE